MKAYAIKSCMKVKGNKHYYLLEYSIRNGRNLCIRTFVKKYSGFESWQELYRSGYRCVPVLIAEVKP